MLTRCLSVSLMLAAAWCISGCGDEEGPSPEEKWGEETQSVRAMIFRDGTVVRAINAFKMNSGRLPSKAEGLAALIKRPKGLDPGLWKGPYLDGPESYTDMWGNELKYRYPSKPFADDKNLFDVWSAGPNGKDDGGEGDDILNHNVR